MSFLIANGFTECTVSLYQATLQKVDLMHQKHLMWNYYGEIIIWILLQIWWTTKMFCCLLRALWNRSVKRETLKLIETFLDKAEDQAQIGKQFVPPMMDPVLGDYARNLPDARESEVLSLFATIINKYVVFFLCFSCMDGRWVFLEICNLWYRA